MLRERTPRTTTRIGLTAVLATLLLTACGTSDNAVGDSAAEGNSVETGEATNADIDFPSQDIVATVPYGPGGATDVIARIVGQHGPDHVGTNIVIQNREGAGGTVGTAEVANANADGHQLLIGPVGPFTTQFYLQDNLPYSLDDFEPIINLTNAPTVGAAVVDRGWDDITDAIEEFRDSGETLTYASPGTGSLPHLAHAALFSEYEDLNWEHIPFDGAEGIPALLAGDVDIATQHPHVMGEYVEAGDISYLGVFSEERQPDIPDVPTIKELTGHSTYWDVYTFIMAPKGTPEEVIDYLHESFGAMMDSEDFLESLEDVGVSTRRMNPDELRETLSRDRDTTIQLLEELDL